MAQVHAIINTIEDSIVRASESPSFSLIKQKATEPSVTARQTPRGSVNVKKLPAERRRRRGKIKDRIRIKEASETYRTRRQDVRPSGAQRPSALRCASPHGDAYLQRKGREKEHRKHIELADQEHRKHIELADQEHRKHIE